LRLSTIEHTVDMSLEELVTELVEAREALKVQEQAVFYIERAVVEKMQERGATVVNTESGQAKLTTPVSYDYSKLAALREITNPSDLVGYTPSREVTKVEPEKWNVTKAKTLAHLSHEHAEIIEDAKIHGDSRIKFIEKKGEKY